MKKIFYIISIIILYIFVSCDKVEPPYIENPVIIDTNNNEGTKRVLIEEFTGHLCPNCPEAAHITKV